MKNFSSGSAGIPSRLKQAPLKADKEAAGAGMPIIKGDTWTIHGRLAGVQNEKGQPWGDRVSLFLEKGDKSCYLVLG